MRPLSVLSTIVTGDLRVVPIIALDFSLNNLTGRHGTLHQTDLAHKRNDYLDLIKVISKSFNNITNLPMFGFGAKTSSLQQ